MLFLAADLFQFPEILEACCNLLKSQLHPTNYLRIGAFANLHGLSNLSTAVADYIGENFS